MDCSLQHYGSYEFRAGPGTRTGFGHAGDYYELRHGAFDRFAFTLSLICYLIAALSSWLRGEKYIHEES